MSDIEPGAEGSYPEHLVSDGTTLYFFTSRNGFWKIDDQGLQLAKDMPMENSPWYPTVAGGMLYFALYEGSAGNLWRCDGTEEGTFVLKDLTNTEITKIFAADNKLMFIVDGVLWKSEGTACSTIPLTNASSAMIASAATTKTGNKLMLAASTEGGLELFYYDYSNFNTPGCSQTIDGFADITVKTFGDAPFTVDAWATSELPVYFASSDPSVAVVNGNTVTIVGAGEAIITAIQTGSVEYAPATGVNKTLVVKKAIQTVSFEAIGSRMFGDPAFELKGTASSDLAVSYTSSNTSVATIHGTTVTIVGSGSTVITAVQAGNENYERSPEVNQTFTVQLITGVGDVPSESIQMYPNPATDYVNIEGQIHAKATPVLVDIQGRVINVPVHTIDTSKFRIDLGQLTPGMYIVQVTTTDGRKTSERIVRK